MADMALLRGRPAFFLCFLIYQAVCNGPRRLLGIKFTPDHSIMRLRGYAPPLPCAAASGKSATASAAASARWHARRRIVEPRRQLTSINKMVQRGPHGHHRAPARRAAASNTSLRPPGAVRDCVASAGVVPPSLLGTLIE